METLFVNLFAGPGCGKSTTAAGVFYRLKRQGVNAEYIQEYAKDATWRHDQFTLKCQPYVTGKQLFRQYRLDGQVQVAVTDSPILIGLAYGGFAVTETYQKWLLETHNLFTNLNILLTRDPESHPYVQAGRSQSENEAKIVDSIMKDLLIDNEVPYYEIKADHSAVGNIVELIKLNTKP